MNWEMRSDCYKILLLYFPSSLWIYPLERDLWGKILSDAWFFSFCCLSLPFFFWFLKLLFKFLNFSFILGTRKFLCYFKMYENLWIHIAVWFKSTILHIYLSWNLSSTFAHLRARFWNQGVWLTYAAYSARYFVYAHSWTVTTVCFVISDFDTVCFIIPNSDVSLDAKCIFKLLYVMHSIHSHHLLQV